MTLSVREYLERGSFTSKEIQSATGLSQTSVARRLREMGNSVVQLSKGRSIRYATVCNAFGGDDKLPLSMVDSNGNTSVIAYIRPLNHGGFFVEPTKDISLMLLGDNRDGLYDGLPYFLYDLRPQGFLGRQIAQRIASQSEDFPSDPRNWTNNHIGRYLISNGEDLPGNLIFGEQSLLRVRRKPFAVSQSDYFEIADKVIEGEPIGSSAGGEQPKFTVFNSDTQTHVIVKFSLKDDNKVAERWHDILISEYHASKIINDNIFPTAETKLFEMQGRLFLETNRFDRLGEFGRSSMISLKSIDEEFIGFGHNWAKVMRELFNKKMISERDALSAESLWLFGQLINNSDMHLGNLSLALEDDSFRLLPVYDMCSMGFAPKSGGEVQSFAYEIPDILNVDISKGKIETVIKLAHSFWENIANDDRISNQFKVFLDHGNPVESLL